MLNKVLNTEKFCFNRRKYLSTYRPFGSIFGVFFNTWLQIFISLFISHFYKMYIHIMWFNIIHSETGTQHVWWIHVGACWHNRNLKKLFVCLFFSSTIAKGYKLLRRVGFGIFFFILAIPEMSVNSDTLCVHNQNNAMVLQIALAAHSFAKATGLKNIKINAKHCQIYTQHN